MIMKHSTYVGDILWMKNGTKRELVKVLKINPKNIKVQTEAGQRYNCPPSLLFGTTGTEADSFSSTPTGAALVLGQTVRFHAGTSLAAKCKYDLLVVIGQTSGTYRLAPLGGDGGRYYRGITSGDVEIVSFSLAGL